MRKFDKKHRYEYDPSTGMVKDYFGDNMADVDEFVDELNMLMDDLRKWKEAAELVGDTPEELKNFIANSI